MQIGKVLGYFYLFGLLLCSLSAEIRPNILFIAIDDLRPELGCYGSKVVQSPHLDQLALVGRRFDRAYCQQSICSPSRASLMTGARPDEIGVVENTAYFRELNPKIITLPQHFIKHGYEAIYCGKIYHGRMTDDKYSWSQKPAFERCPVKRSILPGGYARSENQMTWARNKETMLAQYGQEGSGGLIHGPAYEFAAVPDYTYADGYSTQLAIATLKDHLQNKPNKPIFLALGFKKPHLDFVAPKKYWDLYDRNDIKLAGRANGPKGGSKVGLHASFELRTRHGIPKDGPLDPNLAKTLLHGYYACVSYVDAQIGMMLEALEEEKIRDNTLIVVWGDHGWHLGEMGIWGKATNYEIATRVPLIVSIPEMKERGQGTNELVELIDIFPTLCELSGLPKPKHLAGRSFVPLLDDPNKRLKKFAISQFPNPALREWAANPLSSGMRKTFFGSLIVEIENQIKEQYKNQWDRELFENHLMGYTLRTDFYRLVAWLDYRDVQKKPLHLELYDHRKDPQETVNIATEFPEKANELLRKLLTIGIGKK